MDHTKEMIDIVDDNDNVIETISRAEVTARGTRHFRVAAAFIKNKYGELWIPKHVLSKRQSPGYWALVGGCVQSGETYEQGFARETLEEVGIDVAKVPYKELGYFRLQDGAHSFKKIFEIQVDEITAYDKSEFLDARWMKPQEILDRKQNGEHFLRDIPWMVEKFYL